MINKDIVTKHIVILSEDEKSLEFAYKKKFKKELKYKKNDKEFLKNFTEEMIKTAIKNTKKLEKYHDQNAYKEQNPSSKIYKIIEFLDKNMLKYFDY